MKLLKWLFGTRSSTTGKSGDASSSHAKPLDKNVLRLLAEGKKPGASSPEASGAATKPREGQNVAIVKNPGGGTCGLWVRQTAMALDRDLLGMLSINLNLPDDCGMAIFGGNYRVVANTHDDAGGSFVMFGSALAPGEQAESSNVSGRCQEVGKPTSKPSTGPFSDDAANVQSDVDTVIAQLQKAGMTDGCSADQLSEMKAAAAVVVSFRNRDRMKLLKDAGGKPVGYWVADALPVEKETSCLEIAAAIDKLSAALRMMLTAKQYRIVPNKHDSRAGQFVMFWSARAPGEQIPPLSSMTWQKGQPNPKSDAVSRFALGDRTGIQFQCPTCGLPNYAFDSNILSDVGANVGCEHCGNVAHVPAAYKSATVPADAAIRACVYLPTSEFRDWCLSHPSYASASIESLGSYGLWAYCANCKHQFAGTALVTFAMAQALGGNIMINASSLSSGRDMTSLSQGHCPACSASNLLALMIDIPQSVQALISQRRTARST